jgi:hypothetical protein
MIFAKQKSKSYKLDHYYFRIAFTLGEGKTNVDIEGVMTKYDVAGFAYMLPDKPNYVVLLCKIYYQYYDDLLDELDENLSSTTHIFSVKKIYCEYAEQLFHNWFTFDFDQEYVVKDKWVYQNKWLKQ